MITFGLTGNIACGKSTVSKTLQAHNIPMIDADMVARQVVEPGTPGLDAIVDAFGDDFLLSDGTLDRTALGQLVFASKEGLYRLNQIMGPLISSERDRQMADLLLAGHKIIGWDAALIVESGNAEKFRPLIVVQCPMFIQLERLMSRNSLTREDAMRRIEAQLPTEEKVKLADFVIDTSKEISHSINQTIKIIEHLKTL